MSFQPVPKKIDHTFDATGVSEKILGATLLQDPFSGARIAHAQLSPSDGDTEYEVELQESPDGENNWENALGETLTQANNRVRALDIAVNTWYRFSCTSLTDTKTVRATLIR